MMFVNGIPLQKSFLNADCAAPGIVLEAKICVFLEGFDCILWHVQVVGLHAGIHTLQVLKALHSVLGVIITFHNLVLANLQETGYQISDLPGLETRQVWETIIFFLDCKSC